MAVLSLLNPTITGLMFLPWSIKFIPRTPRDEELEDFLRKDLQPSRLWDW
jgi:hypothetical protein